MYKGIVFDEMQRNAFLSIADNEGLICEKGMSDGIYKSVTQFNPSYQITKNIFEQFIVAGTIYIDPITYKYLDGELIEKNIIMPYEENKKDVFEFCYFDVSNIQKMLKENNYDTELYTEEKIREIFYELKEKIVECVGLEDEYNFDYNTLQFRKLFFETGLSNRLENKEKVEYYLNLKSSIIHNTLYKILVEYKKLLNIAFSNDLICPVIDNSETKTPYVKEYDDAIKILRYTSERLGRIYVANNIKDNLNLVQSDEARAYRTKVNEWMTALSKIDYNSMEVIESDIVKVQNAMKHKKWIEITGKLCATVGVGASLIAHNPIGLTASIIAEIATYIGAPTAFYDPLKNEKYLWASFGMEKRL